MSQPVKIYLVTSIGERIAGEDLFGLLSDEISSIATVEFQMANSYRSLILERANRILEVCHCNDGASNEQRTCRFNSLWRERLLSLANQSLQQRELQTGVRHYTFRRIQRENPQKSLPELYELTNFQVTLEDFTEFANQSREAYLKILDALVADTLVGSTAVTIKREKNALSLSTH